MSKQTKILTWINKYLTKQFISDPEFLPADECLGEAKKILKYLHSKDVAIKVKRKLPKDFVGISYLSGNGGVIKSVWVDEDKLKEAGYGFFEPLIEEEKDIVWKQ